MMRCLGQSLRRNRTLTELKCDGQRSELDSWAIFRGCFYGNRKITSLSVMWNDIKDYFASRRSQFQVHANEAARIKPMIGYAHRQGDLKLKRQRITEMVSHKKAFKSIERNIAKALRVLSEIYDAVALNAGGAIGIANKKREADFGKPQFQELVDRLGTKMVTLLTSLRDALNNLTRKIFRPEPGDCHSRGSWEAVEASFGTGVHFFNPDTFNNFASLIEGLDIDVSDRVLNMLSKISDFIENIYNKAEKYGCDIYALLNILVQRIKPHLFLQFQHLRLQFKTDNVNDNEDCDDDDKNNDEDQHDNDVHADDADAGDAAVVDASAGVISDDMMGSGSEDGSVGDGENQNGIDVEKIGELYAGCGPRDLPDGGSSGRSVDKVCSGRRAASLRIARIGVTSSAQSGLFEASRRASVAKSSVFGLLQKMQGDWRRIIGEYIRAHSESTMTVREFDTCIRFATVGHVDGQSVCSVATQCTVDRLPRLEALMRAWGGEVSAAIYVPTSSKVEITTTILAIEAFTNKLRVDGSYKGSLVVSLLYGFESNPEHWDENFPGCAAGPMYPINALRNLAVGALISSSLATVPPLLFLLDVDFVPSRNLLSCISANCEMKQKCMAGAVFVVPAFENDISINSQTAANFVSKSDILTGLSEGKVSPFHVSYFPRGHAPTDYER